MTLSIRARRTTAPRGRDIRILATALTLVGAALFGVGADVTVSASPAAAESNGLGATPLMGWSSWSFVGNDPTAAKIDAQADAMKSSGLGAVGFDYINVDDYYYLCNSSGPEVDANGLWIPNPAQFPNDGSTPGFEAVANHVHADGFKFGMYVTPGIPENAVTAKSKIAGTDDTANEIATTTSEHNYNCGHMVGIDYSKAGAQAYINSWADELASWGVDYVKLDGVGASDIDDVQAWSTALKQTGRPMWLELSNDLPIADAKTWSSLANGWRTNGDIECYCWPGGSKTSGTVRYPLTDWSNVTSRFNTAANWGQYAGPGGWNDFDSLEVGNGSNDGLTVPERQSMMTLWSMGASPLVLGTDLTNLDPTDLAMLKNKAVISVDQDAVAAKRIVDSGNGQAFSKKEKNGDTVIALFNTSASASTTVSVPLSSAGVSGSVTATDLWTGASTGTISGTYSVTLGPGAVKLIRTGTSSSATTIAASASGNTLAGAAKVVSCSGCATGEKVGDIGDGAANYVTINGVPASKAGSTSVTVSYLLDGSRSFSISVNGGAATTLSLTGTSWSTPATASVSLDLNAGTNTIKFFNDSVYAPDLDSITVG
jgi:alpha-galactosidase